MSSWAAGERLRTDVIRSALADSLSNVGTRHEFLGELARTALWDGTHPAAQAAGAVLNEYRRWTPTSRKSPDSIEIFAPSLLRSESDLADFGADGERIPVPAPYHQWAVEILHLCLFVDRIWVPDPAEILARTIDDIVRPSLAIHDSIEDPLRAYYALDALLELEPLVDSGIVAFYPPLAVYEGSVSDRLFDEVRSFTPRELASAWPELFVAEGLLYADKLGASYAALNRSELQAIRGSQEHLRDHAGATNARVVAAIPRMKLPYFDQVSPELLISVRQNEAAFEDFRDILRGVVRDLPEGVKSPAFEEEVRRVERDRLNPAIEDLLGSVNGSTALRSSLSEAGIDFAAMGLAGFAIAGDAIGAMGVGAATVVAKALIKIAIGRKSTRPAAEVVLSFNTGRLPKLGLLELLRRPVSGYY